MGSLTQTALEVKMMLVLLLIAPSLTVALNLPCNVLDGNPFFQEKARYTYMELPLIYDYARYMDSSVPALLMELATKKRETAKLDMEWRQGRQSDALPQNIDSLMDRGVLKPRGRLLKTVYGEYLGRWATAIVALGSLPTPSPDSSTQCPVLIFKIDL